MVVAPGNHASYSIADYDYNNVEIGIRTIPIDEICFSFFLPSINLSPLNPLAIRSYIYIVGELIFAYRIRYACRNRPIVDVIFNAHTLSIETFSYYPASQRNVSSIPFPPPVV